jgi:hypothetical protein
MCLHIVQHKSYSHVVIARPHAEPIKRSTHETLLHRIERVLR